MPNFDAEFAEAKGKPVTYKDIMMIRIDRIPVNKKFRGYLRVISTNSEYKQGVSIDVDKKLTINEITGKKFIIWEEHAKSKDVYFEGESKKGELIVYNSWGRGKTGIDAWIGGAAMIQEIDGNVRRYRCNDGHPDDNFDDIIFEIEILEEEKNSEMLK